MAGKPKDIFAPPSQEDDIFAPPSKEEERRLSMKPMRNATDISSIFAGVNKQNKDRKYTPEEIAQGESTAEAIGAPVLGLLSGASSGYSERAFGDRGKKIAANNPLKYGAGQMAGALAPGMAITKGLKAVSKLSPILSFLGRSGPLQGVVSGGIQGAISDPGEEGSRGGRAAGGAGMGLALGGLSSALGPIARQAKLFKIGNNPGKGDTLAEVSQKELDGALKQLLSRQVTPRKKELSKVLEGTEVEFNPDLLRGMNRSASVGASRTKGGLDRLLDNLEKKARASAPSSPSVSVLGLAAKGAASPSVKVTGKQAQRIKQYLDKRSDWGFKGLLGDDSKAKDEGAQQLANIFRRKVSDLSPKVKALNEPMSEALDAVTAAKRGASQSPIEFLKSSPMASRGSIVSKVDQLAGSKLKQFGKDLAGATRMQTAYDGPVTTARDIFRDLKRSVGTVAGATPDGSKEALIAQILAASRRPYSEEK